MSSAQQSIASFWSFFAAHKDEFDVLTDPDSDFWNDALGELQEVNEGLFFELSAPMDGVREFVVTPDGDVTLFELVDELIKAAPVVKGWKFVALKPAMGFDFQTSYEGTEFDPGDMWFLPLDSADEPDGLGLRIGIIGLRKMDYDTAASAVVMILDTGLGERAAAEEIQHIELAELPERAAEEGYIELAELGDFIAWKNEAKRKRKGPRGVGSDER